MNQTNLSQNIYLSSIAETEANFYISDHLSIFFFMNPFKHISKKILETMKTMNHSFFAIWYTVFMLNLSLIIFTEQENIYSHVSKRIIFIPIFCFVLQLCLYLIHVLCMIWQYRVQFINLLLWFSLFYCLLCLQPTPSFLSSFISSISFPFDWNLQRIIHIRGTFYFDKIRFKVQ